MMKQKIISLLFLISAANSFSQNIGISDNNATPNSMAILDISSSTNNKGVLLPRVTTAQMTAITGTAALGLTVYNTTENMYYYNNSTTATANWVPILSNVTSTTSSLGGWSILGNAGTTAGTNYLGTSTALDLVVKTGGTERVRVTSGGNVGIDVAAPAYSLTLSGNNSVFGIENTATFVAKNSAGTYEAYFTPRHSDNITYLNYGSGGYNIRNNASASTMFITNANEVGVNMTSGISEKLDVTGNILASGTVYWGESNTRSERRDDAGSTGSSTSAGAKSGFFYTDAPSPAADWPVGASSWWHLLDVRHSNTGNNYAMQIAGSYFDQNLYYRKTNNSASTAWTKFLKTSDLPAYSPTKTTFAQGTTTVFYSDSYILIRWNGGVADVEFAAQAGYTGSWAFYNLYEPSEGGTSSDAYCNSSSSSGPTDWKYVTGDFIGSSYGTGGTIWLSRVNDGTTPVYKVTCLRHGTYKTAIVERIDP